MDQINLLPDHILAEIFGNLSPRMIKCCALVCKRWDNIVGTSRELMERFNLNLWQKSNTEIQEAKSLQRNHQTAKIRFQKTSLDAISCHNLQSLTIFSYDETKLSQLIETLNCFPSLKTFDASYQKFADDVLGTNDIQPKVRNNLIELECNLKIIHIFDCHSIEKLKLVYENPVEDARKLCLVDFLKKQENLQSFTISGESDGEFFNFPGILELNCMLKEFTFRCGFEPLTQFESLIKFLDGHKNSLISLNAFISTDPQFGIEFIHKFALEKIVNLKHLKLGYLESEFDGYIGDELSYNELPAATEITKNLESLAVRARSSDMNENRRFYDMFPNLKCLDLDSSEHAECPDIQLLHCISERCVNIEKISTSYFDSENDIPGIIYFPKLKEFTIDSYNTEESLCAFINCHSQTLERISIGGIDGLTHLTTKEILNCKNLVYLKLGFWLANLYFYGMLSEISSKTTPFTLDFKGFKSPFKFPDDKAIWDEEIKDLESKINESIFCGQ